MCFYPFRCAQRERTSALCGQFVRREELGHTIGDVFSALASLREIIELCLRKLPDHLALPRDGDSVAGKEKCSTLRAVRQHKLHVIAHTIDDAFHVITPFPSCLRLYGNLAALA